MLLVIINCSLGCFTSELESLTVRNVNGETKLSAKSGWVSPYTTNVVPLLLLFIKTIIGEFHALYHSYALFASAMFSSPVTHVKKNAFTFKFPCIVVIFPWIVVMSSSMSVTSHHILLIVVFMLPMAVAMAWFCTAFVDVAFNAVSITGLLFKSP